MSMHKVAVVTGGTSGIGKETALALRAAGYTVYELSRRTQGVEGLEHIPTDITREEMVNAAISQVMEREGRIDVLVNNAGFGISGAIEFTPVEEAKRLFDANFFGMVRMNRAVIPVMRRQGGGRIVNLSSVAAPIPIPFQAYYSATKAAVNAYTMALANELRPFGVTVCAVQPGDIKTGFTAAREKVIEGDDVYGGRISRSVGRMEHDEQTGMDPSVAGHFIAGVAQKRTVKPLYTIGFSYKLFTFLVRILPSRTLNWLVGLLYAK
ncbi:MAG: SDR family oxidoreductase [Ruminococcaceae bacterium]|jgi:NAD(P)-dependent dehydrogenase (short-subunit alcohol dehydrogenase family)|nr:SDR family oxidoreductase [Oscillospiraceae bacterium]